MLVKDLELSPELSKASSWGLFAFSEQLCMQKEIIVYFIQHENVTVGNLYLAAPFPQTKSGSREENFTPQVCMAERKAVKEGRRQVPSSAVAALVFNLTSDTKMAIKTMGIAAAASMRKQALQPMSSAMPPKTYPAYWRTGDLDVRLHPHLTTASYSDIQICHAHLPIMMLEVSTESVAVGKPSSLSFLL